MPIIINIPGQNPFTIRIESRQDQCNVTDCDKNYFDINVTNYEITVDKSGIVSIPLYFEERDDADNFVAQLISQLFLNKELDLVGLEIYTNLSPPIIARLFADLHELQYLKVPITNTAIPIIEKHLQKNNVSLVSFCLAHSRYPLKSFSNVIQHLPKNLVSMKFEVPVEDNASKVLCDTHKHTLKNLTLYYASPLWLADIRDNLLNSKLETLYFSHNTKRFTHFHINELFQVINERNESSSLKHLYLSNKTTATNCIPTIIDNLESTKLEVFGISNSSFTIEQIKGLVSSIPQTLKHLIINLSYLFKDVHKDKSDQMDIVMHIANMLLMDIKPKLKSIDGFNTNLFTEIATNYTIYSDEYPGKNPYDFLQENPNILAFIDDTSALHDRINRSFFHKHTDVSNNTETQYLSTCTMDSLLDLNDF